MQISTRGRYAVRILLDVAKNGNGCAVRMQDISLRQGIPIKYAEQITALLVKGGLLRSVRGAGGGYVLTGKPEEYKISEILQKTEGELAPADCVSEGGTCDRAGFCAARGLWEGLRNVMIDYLDSVNLQTLLESSADSGDHYII